MGGIEAKGREGKRRKRRSEHADQLFKGRKREREKECEEEKKKPKKKKTEKELIYIRAVARVLEGRSVSGGTHVYAIV